MAHQIYERSRIVAGDDLEFLKTDWHVFTSREEATAYGLKREYELNDVA